MEPGARFAWVGCMTNRDGPVQAGLYACSPKGAGLEVRFEHLAIWSRSTTN